MELARGSDGRVGEESGGAGAESALPSDATRPAHVVRSPPPLGPMSRPTPSDLAPSIELCNVVAFDIGVVSTGERRSRLS